MKIRKVIWLVLVGMLVLSTQTIGAEPLKVKFGYTLGAVPADLTPILYAKPEILKHYGKTYTVELINFGGSSAMIAALAAKEIDMGYLAFASFASALIEAKLDIVAYGDLQQDGVRGYFSHIFAALETSGIRSIKDLKGKIVAVPLFGTGLDLGARVALKKEGLIPEKDVRMVEVSFGNVEPMLREKKIDVGPFVPTLWYVANAKGGLVPVFTESTGMGRVQMLVHVARKDFLQKNKAVMPDFFEDYVIARRYILNPTHQEEASKMTAKFLRRPVEQIRPWAFKKKDDFYRDRDGYIDVDALQKNVDLLYEMGFIKAKLDVKKHIDHSYIQNAVRKIGKE
jgi:sulfonate transport system substrate-binding protein